MQDITPILMPLAFLAFIRHNQTTIIANKVLDVMGMPFACHLVEGLYWAMLVCDTYARFGADTLSMWHLSSLVVSNCRGTCAWSCNNHLHVQPSCTKSTQIRTVPLNKIRTTLLRQPIARTSLACAW